MSDDCIPVSGGYTEAKYWVLHTPLKDWANPSSGPLANQKLSLAPLAAITVRILLICGTRYCFTAKKTDALYENVLRKIKSQKKVAVACCFSPHCLLPPPPPPPPPPSPPSRVSVMPLSSEGSGVADRHTRRGATIAVVCGPFTWLQHGVGGVEWGGDMVKSERTPPAGQ